MIHRRRNTPISELVDKQDIVGFILGSFGEHHHLLLLGESSLAEGSENHASNTVLALLGQKHAAKKTPKLV